MQEVQPRRPTRKKIKNETDRDKRPKHSSPSFFSNESYIFTFVLVTVALLIYDVILTSESAASIEAVRQDLIESVHIQTEPLSVILDSLDSLHNHERSVEIVNFFGSTGVGKTFITNILKRHYNRSVFEFNIFHDSTTKQSVLSRIKHASPNSLNLIIVDDLVVDDVENLLTFLQEIPQELMALVVCIFNIQETDNNLNHNINYQHVDLVIERFNKAEVVHKVAKFHEFDENQARDWVLKQLELHQVDPQLRPRKADSILRGHDFKYHGLKGLGAKINLEL